MFRVRIRVRVRTIFRIRYFYMKRHRKKSFCAFWSCINTMGRQIQIITKCIENVLSTKEIGWMLQVTCILLAIYFVDKTFKTGRNRYMQILVPPAWISCRVQREQRRDIFHKVSTNNGEKDICHGIEHLLTENIEIYQFVT